MSQHTCTLVRVHVHLQLFEYECSLPCTAKAILFRIHTTFNLTSEPLCSMGNGLTIVENAASCSAKGFN